MEHALGAHALAEGAHALAAPVDAAMHAAMPHAHHGGGGLTWRPTVDATDCRLRGLVAHALLLGALAMVVLPHAVAVRSSRRFQGAALIMFLGAAFSNALQRTCRARGAPSALASGNMHAVLGWAFVSAAVAMAFALPQLTLLQQGALRVVDDKLSRASTLVLGAPTRLHGWALSLALVRNTRCSYNNQPRAP